MLMHQKLSRQPVISVLIPARNEARNLEYVLPTIPSIVGEVILIDGHSTNDTIAVAQALLPSIRIVQQIGKGKGDAIRAGLEASTGEIPRFVEVLMAGNHFAKGSRFTKGGASHDITPLRWTGNYILSKLVNLLYRSHFSDLCYGYNAFWRRCSDRLNIDNDGFEIETLINIRMHQAGFQIVEVPSVEYARIHGVSKLHPFKDGWRVLQIILRERLSKVSSQSQLPKFASVFSSEGQTSIIEEMVP